ncbi:hypothetical protein [Actinomadura xylanilytica]|uniref:hypothetical protein n=1 Tax=Actinomadura xylanilytica TaxID=887459 RepID=UPI00255B3FA3|nr:hypothetical protein [Actinomadura xylanilytica]MDL4774270.1 hypothetical protein [Actinomadura xylanilytica]
MRNDDRVGGTCRPPDRSPQTVTGPVDAVCLPSDTDLADILRDQGRASVREALLLAVPLADLVVDASIERSGGTLELPEHRVAALHAAARLIAQMRAPEVARQISRVATRTDLDTATVTAALASAISPEPTRDPAADDFPSPPLTGPEHAPASTRTTRQPDHSVRHRGR